MTNTVTPALVAPPMVAKTGVPLATDMKQCLSKQWLVPTADSTQTFPLPEEGFLCVAPAALELTL